MRLNMLIIDYAGPQMARTFDDVDVVLVRQNDGRFATLKDRNRRFGVIGAYVTVDQIAGHLRGAGAT